MAARPPAVEFVVDFLDAILTIATPTIDFVHVLGRVGKMGRDELRIVLRCAPGETDDLGLVDHSTLRILPRSLGISSRRPGTSSRMRGRPACGKRPQPGKIPHRGTADTARCAARRRLEGKLALDSMRNGKEAGVSADEGHEHFVLASLILARCRTRGRTRAIADLAKIGGLEVLADPSRREAVRTLLPGRLGRELTSARLRRCAEREIAMAHEQGWTLLADRIPGYPALLRSIGSPPIVLSLAGDPKTLAGPMVAIVGSRRPSSYGEKVAKRLASQLAERGLVVVSGLARGIDAAAHRGALEAGGRTVAVLATGLDRVYPPEHHELAARITESGALLSEFPPGSSPKRDHFPRRNRIVSGLSLGVVVVEAAQRSGSLITAGSALEQGREVFAVPGRIDDPFAAGTLDLLCEGAKIVRDAEDVVSQLAVEARWLLEPSADHLPRETSEPRAHSSLQLIPPDAGEEGKLIMKIFDAQAEVNVDEVLDRLDLPTDDVLAALFALEIAGLLTSKPGGWYARSGDSR